MPTVCGVPPSRTKKRRVAPPRVSRPMRIVKALGHPNRLKKKCKGMVKSFVQKKLAQRLNRCIRAFQVEAEEEQKPLENIEVRGSEPYSEFLDVHLGMRELILFWNTVQADLSPERDQKSVNIAWSA